MPVQDPCLKYQAMKMDYSWDLIDTLIGGTQKMRNAGEVYLPRFKEEDIVDWASRRDMTVLHPGFTGAVEQNTSLPFSKPMTIKYPDLAMEESISEIKKNWDGTGMSMTMWFRKAFAIMMTWGKVHAFVDFSQVDGASVLNKAEEDALSPRPINRLIMPKSLIGWKTVLDKTTKLPRITEIRVLEETIVDEENWRQVQQSIIRVITKDRWDVWIQKAANGEYTKGEGGVITGLDAIPMASCYTEQIEPMVAKPPFLEVAHMNHAHWRASSDYRNSLQFNAMGILFGRGFTPKEVEEGIVLSPKQCKLTINEDADLKVVEHSGVAIEAACKNLEDLENKMDLHGSRPMVQKVADVKAVTTVSNDKKSRSLLESWVIDFNQFVAECIVLNLRWMGYEVGTSDIEVHIHQDFVFSAQGDAAELSALKSMRDGRDISHETYINEMKRYGVLSDNVNPKIEKILTSREAPTGSPFNMSWPTQNAPKPVEAPYRAGTPAQAGERPATGLVGIPKGSKQTPGKEEKGQMMQAMK